MGATVALMGQIAPPVSARARRAGTVLIILGCVWGAPLLLLIVAAFLGLMPTGTTQESAAWQAVMVIVAGIAFVAMPLPRVLAGIAIRRGSRRARQIAMVMTAIWVGLGALQAVVFLFTGLGAMSGIGWMEVVMGAIAATDLGASAWVVWALAKDR